MSRATEPASIDSVRTPSLWSMAVATGAGLLSFVVCKRLFRQSREASLLQTYIVVSTTLGALHASEGRSRDTRTEG